LTYQLCGDAARVAECAQRVVALCDRYGFAYYGEWARVLLGWGAGCQGEPRRGVDIIESALARLDVLNAKARRPYYLSLLADTLVADGDSARAASVLQLATASAVERDDCWWLPELYRQRAALAPAGSREA